MGPYFRYTLHILTFVLAAFVCKWVLLVTELVIERLRAKSVLTENRALNFILTSENESATMGIRDDNGDYGDVLHSVDCEFIGSKLPQKALQQRKEEKSELKLTRISSVIL